MNSTSTANQLFFLFFFKWQWPKQSNFSLASPKMMHSQRKSIAFGDFTDPSKNIYVIVKGLYAIYLLMSTDTIKYSKMPSRCQPIMFAMFSVDLLTFSSWWIFGALMPFILRKSLNSVIWVSCRCFHKSPSYDWVKIDFITEFTQVWPSRFQRLLDRLHLAHGFSCCSLLLRASQTNQSHHHVLYRITSCFFCVFGKFVMKSIVFIGNAIPLMFSFNPYCAWPEGSCSYPVWHVWPLETPRPLNRYHSNVIMTQKCCVSPVHSLCMG